MSFRKFLLYLIKTLKKEVGFESFSDSIINAYHVLCKILNILRIPYILNYIIIKLNQIINKYYHVLLGSPMIYFLMLVILLCNDRYVQTFLGLCIFLDFLVQFFKYNNNTDVKNSKYLTPSLNIYYPISFSLFSVTIRITGIFLSLVLGFGSLFLFLMC